MKSAELGVSGPNTAFVPHSVHFAKGRRMETPPVAVGRRMPQARLAAFLRRTRVGRDLLQQLQILWLLHEENIAILTRASKRMKALRVQSTRRTNAPRRPDVAKRKKYDAGALEPGRSQSCWGNKIQAGSTSDSTSAARALHQSPHRIRVFGTFTNQSMVNPPTTNLEPPIESVFPGDHVTTLNFHVFPGDHVTTLNFDIFPGDHVTTLNFDVFPRVRFKASNPKGSWC